MSDIVVDVKIQYEMHCPCKQIIISTCTLFWYWYYGRLEGLAGKMVQISENSV